MGKLYDNHYIMIIKNLLSAFLQTGTKVPKVNFENLLAQVQLQVLIDIYSRSCRKVMNDQYIMTIYKLLFIGEKYISNYVEKF
jgi:hypothetical protein